MSETTSLILDGDQSHDHMELEGIYQICIGIFVLIHQYISLEKPGMLSYLVSMDWPLYDACTVSSLHLENLFIILHFNLTLCLKLYSPLVLMPAYVYSVVSILVLRYADELISFILFHFHLHLTLGLHSTSNFLVLRISESCCFSCSAAHWFGQPLIQLENSIWYQSISCHSVLMCSVTLGMRSMVKR